MFRLTAVLAVAAAGLVLLLSGPGASGQNTREPGVKERGQLPQGWKKIGLSDDQVQKVYAIQSQYRAKINKLAAEIKQLRAEERRDLFKVLTDDQKTKLRKLAEERATEPPAPPERRVEPKKQ
jgi:Spy/CpxP family protein refolding chaperone